MNEHTESMTDEIGKLADDAQALMAATADVNEAKVKDARSRLAAAVERSKEICGRVRAKAVAGAKAVDAAVHEHPYQAIAIGVGLGALIGYLLGRRDSRRD